MPDIGLWGSLSEDSVQNITVNNLEQYLEKKRSVRKTFPGRDLFAVCSKQSLLT